MKLLEAASMHVHRPHPAEERNAATTKPPPGRRAIRAPSRRPAAEPYGLQGSSRGGRIQQERGAHALSRHKVTENGRAGIVHRTQGRRRADSRRKDVRCRVGSECREGKRACAGVRGGRGSAR